MSLADDISMGSDMSDGTHSALTSQTSFGSSLNGNFESGSDMLDQGDNGDEYAVDAEFKAQFDATKAKYEQLRNQSGIIQRKLLEVFQNLGFDDSGGPNVADFPTRYQEALTRFEERRELLQQTRSEFAAELESLSQHCSEADTRRMEKESDFHSLREKTSKGSINQRTNKPVSGHMVNSKENSLSAKEIELENTRIEYIRTKNRHKETEDLLNQQDQLSEGLHLIDFEQLKIENQSLNEKQSEKSQDLVKIRQKIETNAHTLTHVKEKLAFVKKQRMALEVEQKEVDTQYAQARQKLAQVKNQKDKMRDDNSVLKKSSGLIGMNDLLYDFENRSNELELMQDKVTELKTRFNDLMSMQHELEAKIAQRQPLDPSLLKMNR